MDGGIFKYFDKETFAKSLSAFNCCTDLPISALDTDGQVLFSYSGSTSVCNIIQELSASQSRCSEMRLLLCKKAKQTDTGFLTECSCGLNCYVIPIVQNSHVKCIILVGPFLLRTPDHDLTVNLAEACGLCIRNVIKLHESVNTVRVIPQSLLTSINDLVNSMFRFPIPNSITAPQNSVSHKKVIKVCSDSSAYPYEKETLLISEIKSGNIQNASAVLNDLLGYVLFTKNGSIDTAKVRAIELCCVLSRVTIENGATKSGVLNFNNECITSIQTIEDLYALGEKLQEITEVFMSSISQQRKKSVNELIKQATDYIALYYTRPLTLEDLSNHVHLNSSYFSSLFKNNTGTSFKSYLNMIRTENSKSLLSSGDLPLMQVASRVGYQDYNYFSKVFKKLVGMTPSQYRNQFISVNPPAYR